MSDPLIIRNMEATGDPSGQDEIVRYICDQCGAEIYEGEEMYRLDCGNFCEECILNVHCYVEPLQEDPC